MQSNPGNLSHNYHFAAGVVLHALRASPCEASESTAAAATKTSMMPARPIAPVTAGTYNSGRKHVNQKKREASLVISINVWH